MSACAHWQQPGSPRIENGKVVRRLTIPQYVYKLLHHQLLEGPYAGVALELGEMLHPVVAVSPTGPLKSSALFLGADTPLGPFYIGYGFARRREPQRVVLGHP